MRMTFGRRDFLLAAAGLALVPAGAPGADWWLEGGPVFRGAMQFKVTGSSYVQDLALHAASAPLAAPTGIGTPTRYGDRVYDDGYVKLDAGTLNPDAVGGPGATWNWAYDGAGQFNGAANTLAFAKQGPVGYTPTASGSAGGAGQMWGAGLHLLAGVPLHKSGRWEFALALGFDGIWGTHSTLDTSSYRETTGRLNVTDTYNVADTVGPLGFPPPRTAPGGYSGTYGGPADGPSTWVGGYPVINNTPTARTTTPQAVSTAQNAISYRFQTDLYELSLAPRLRFAASQALALHLTPNLGVGLVNVTADRSETFYSTTAAGTATLGAWNDSSSTWQTRFVAGVNLGADYDLGKGFYAGVYGGYNWVVNPVHLTVGPNTASVDDSGYVGGAVLGRKF